MSSVREKSSKKVQRKSKVKKASEVKKAYKELIKEFKELKRENKIVGRKLNAAIQQVYALNVEAYTKVENSPSDFNNGYAIGLTEAIRTMREIERGNYFRFPLFNTKKKKK
jgi:uncharacterized protein with von Willebrand factor type A (vWA) domain